MEDGTLELRLSLLMTTTDDDNDDSISFGPTVAVYSNGLLSNNKLTVSDFGDICEYS